MKKLLILYFLLFAVAFYACKHALPEQPITTVPGSGGGTGGGGGTGTTAVCFESEILPIFQSNCAKSGCHDAATHQDGFILNSYSNLFKKDGKENNNNIRKFNPLDSKLYKVLIEPGSKKMPPPGNQDITPQQISLISRWIKEGAEETKNCATTKCDSNVVTVSFKMHIQPVLNNSCTGCHSGDFPSKNIRLITYDSVKMISNRLYGAVAHLPGYTKMPLGPHPTDPNLPNKLPDCEIALIRKWVAAGAPNN